MTRGTISTPADMMAEGAGQVRSEAGSAINGLVALAHEPDMKETAARPDATAAQLRSDTFDLMVTPRLGEAEEAVSGHLGRRRRTLTTARQV
ncbi:hypothetical protein AB0H73_25370 [Streptomyces olivoreticuli]|uniref:hypothetical protein n=1 Tax=Streptomyces olivoreticuli TaxID=68246 RepID=UPI000E22E1DB|nr:hypothetical protein [Streptomyces olivoreticuli]